MERILWNDTTDTDITKRKVPTYKSSRDSKKMTLRTTMLAADVTLTLNILHVQTETKMACEIRTCGAFPKRICKERHQYRRRTDREKDTKDKLRVRLRGFTCKLNVTPDSRVSGITTTSYIIPLLPLQMPKIEAVKSLSEETKTGPPSSPSSTDTPTILSPTSTTETTTSRLEFKLLVEKNPLETALENYLKSYPLTPVETPSNSATDSGTPSTSTEHTNTSTRSSRSSATEAEEFQSPRRSKRLENNMAAQREALATVAADEVFNEEEEQEATPRRSKRLQSLRDSGNEDNGRTSKLEEGKEEPHAIDASHEDRREHEKRSQTKAK